MKAKLKAVYHMLINIFGRLTLGLTAAFIISIIGFVVYAYVCDYIARRTTPWQANISEKVYKAAFQAQTTLESPKERLIGGGQAVKLPGPTAYLTVYHVAIEAVDAPMRGEFRSKVTSSNTRIESLRGLGCLKWLDLCMLKGTQDHSAADLGELGNSLTKIGDNLFLLAKKTDQNAEGDIHLGVVSNVSPAIITAEIGTRRGYSGSGVYSTDGSLVGLAVSDNSYGINNAVILSTLGFPAYRFMQTTTEIVSATAIRRLQSCFRVEATQGPDCLNAQIDLFLDQMEFLIKGGTAQNSISMQLSNMLDVLRPTSLHNW